MKTVSVKDLQFYKEFPSLGALRTFLNTHPQKSTLYLYDSARLTNTPVRVSTSGPNGEQSHELYYGISDKDWDLGLGYDAAMSILGRSGYWPEGKRLFSKAFFEAKQGLQVRQCPLINRDVAGYQPDVPEFIIGASPCTMMAEDSESGELAASHPIVKIGINQVNHHRVSAQKLLNKGAAILALVDDLERQGLRTEIYSTARVGTCVCVTPELGWDILLKPANQTADPSMLAFPLAHPAWGRRIGYRIVESFPVGICDMCGYVTSIVPSDDDYDIYIGPTDAWNGRVLEPLDTVKDATEMYQKLFREAVSGFSKTKAA